MKKRIKNLICNKYRLILTFLIILILCLLYISVTSIPAGLPSNAEIIA